MLIMAFIMIPTSTPHTSHESLFLLTPSASEMMLVVDGEGVSGVLLWETILILISDTSCSYNAQNRKKQRLLIGGEKK